MARLNQPIFSLFDFLQQVQVDPGVLQNQTFDEFEQRPFPTSNVAGSDPFSNFAPSNFASIQESRLPSLPNFDLDGNLGQAPDTTQGDNPSGTFGDVMSGVVGPALSFLASPVGFVARQLFDMAVLDLNRKVPSLPGLARNVLDELAPGTVTTQQDFDFGFDEFGQFGEFGQEGFGDPGDPGDPGTVDVDLDFDFSEPGFDESFDDIDEAEDDPGGEF